MSSKVCLVGFGPILAFGSLTGRSVDALSRLPRLTPQMAGLVLVPTSSRLVPDERHPTSSIRPPRLYGTRWTRTRWPEIRFPHDRPRPSSRGSRRSMRVYPPGELGRCSTIGPSAELVSIHLQHLDAGQFLASVRALVLSDDELEVHLEARLSGRCGGRAPEAVRARVTEICPTNQVT